MPTYEFKCSTCEKPFDIVCRVAERDDAYSCPDCGASGVRQLSMPAIDKSAAGDWNNVSYNPGLGTWTKSWKHGREIAKSRGLEEVGNEPLDKLHKKAEDRKVEIREERWREADRDKVYD